MANTLPHVHPIDADAVAVLLPDLDAMGVRATLYGQSDHHGTQEEDARPFVIFSLSDMIFVQFSADRVGDHVAFRLSFPHNHGVVTSGAWDRAVVVFGAGAIVDMGGDFVGNREIAVEVADAMNAAVLAVRVWREIHQVVGQTPLIVETEIGGFGLRIVPFAAPLDPSP
jgi:hypothetical protein